MYYDESSPTKDILAVKYFVQSGSIVGLPSNLQGWTTGESRRHVADLARFSPTHKTGVVIATSFRGACPTGLWNPNKLIPVQASGLCFEDQGYTTVDQLCNQGGAQAVNCYYATGTDPNETVQAGLHFIRGYSDLTPTTSGPPAIEGAVLRARLPCKRLLQLAANAFNRRRLPCASPPHRRCRAAQRRVRAGRSRRERSAAGRGHLVHYRLVRGDGTATCNYGVSCSLNGNNGDGPTLTYNTTAAPRTNRISCSSRTLARTLSRLRLDQELAEPHERELPRDRLSQNCRWFFTGDGVFGTSVGPTDAQILAEPIQRSFRGNTVNSSSVQWLRLTQDENCDNGADLPDPEGASALADACVGFRMEMG